MLPDINEVYPQVEDEPMQKCDSAQCDIDLYEGDEIIEYGGYHYCSSDCLVKDLLLQGHAIKFEIRRMKK